MPRPWKKLGSEPGPDLIIARSRFDTFEHPRSGSAMRRLVLDPPEWVNVVALTPEKRLVVVRQFRFGTESLTTEVPGGVVEPGEEPLDTAKRELREETGYTAQDWCLLASVEPNPAFQSNLCHQFLARDARLTHETEWDPGEDIEVATLELEEVRAQVASGAIRHSLILVALGHVLDLRRPQGRV